MLANKKKYDFALTALVVDDNELNCLIAEEFLKKIGFETRVASSGDTALSILEEQSINVILLDCHMPLMDGFQTMDKITERYGDQRPIVIAMTASTVEEDKKRCFASGMNDFISKPVTVEKLKEIIFNHLDQ